jgi:hypothetical protein
MVCNSLFHHKVYHTSLLNNHSRVGGMTVKVYMRDNGVTVVGKAWQVKYILRKYMEEFDTVQEWIEHNKNTTRPVLRRIK